MLTKKTRVIIASVLCITSLVIATHFTWYAIIEWITDTTEQLTQPATESTEKIIEPAADVTQSSPAEDKKESIQAIAIQMTTPREHGSESKIEAFLSSPAASSGFAKKNLADRPRRHRTARRRRKESAFVLQATADKMPEEFRPDRSPQSNPETSAESKQSSSLNASDNTQQDAPAEKKAHHVITVHNKINVKELAVKHWTGTYSPTKLEITLNGIPFIIVGPDAIALDAAQEIPGIDNKISVHYVYEFMNGMRKGSDTIAYHVPSNAERLELSFSWDTAWHVELEGAQRVE